MKRFTSIRIFLLLLAHCCNSQQSQITIDPDGGYTGIVIKINKDVPEDLCPQILSNTKVLLREASTILYNALDQKAFFKSVTIVVPSSWRDSKCQSIIRSPRGGTPYRNADIQISQRHPVYNDEPYTQQSGTCGQQSANTVHLPYTFLVDGNHTQMEYGQPSKLFVKEWAKFRYGIFDEFGFINDHLYPNFYHQNGQIVPSGASNLNLQGVWINVMTGVTGCDPALNPADCLFYPDEKQVGKVECSLGNLHFFPNVTKFCSSSQLATSGPTKHNVLCEGKSAQQVIDQHPDFNKNKQISSATIDPIFEVVRQPEQQYVLVIETSANSMDNHGQWKWVNKAAQKFIRYDLPINSNLAIVTFSNNSKIEHNMIQVHSDQVRARLADTIPDKYHLSKSDERCVLCALQKVIHEVVSDHKAGTHIILVTQGGQDTLSLTDETILKGHILDYNIKISAILTSPKYLPFYDTQGIDSHLVTYQNNIMDFYVELNEAFAHILASDAKYPTEMSQLVHKESLSMTSQVSSGNFLIDSTLGRDTQFGIYVQDEEDHLIKSIRFTDSKGKTYGPFHRMSSDFDLINFKTINFPAGQSPPFSAPNQIGMTWQYSIEWHDTSSLLLDSSRKSIVMVTSKPRSQSEKELIRVEAWVTGNDPLSRVLAAQVLRGDSPVIGAKVMATITLESTSNGSIVTLPPIRLHDNGFGDPDIISGDGIYSRYLGHYNQPGRYRFNIYVDDNENNAFYVLSDQQPHLKKPKLSNLTLNYGDLYFAMSSKRKCCGSSTLPSLNLEKNPSKIERIGVFRRQILGPVLNLNDLKRTELDEIPPSKIGDLKIRPLPGSKVSDRLIAEWTAPGGDFDAGSVASYRFVFSSNIQDLLDPRGQPQVLLGFDRIERAGTAAKFDFNFPHYGQDFYVGAYAFDMAGNRGKISNLVHVKIESTKVEVAEESAPEPIVNQSDFEPNWVIIGSICGAISILLIVVIFTISYCIYVSKKKSSKSGSTSSVIGVTSSGDDSSSFDSDIKNIMANPLGPALALPRQVHQQNGPISSPPSVETTSTNVTPVYWSASQLLSKLDHPGHQGHFYVAPGPQSLQINQFHRSQNQQPISLHNVSYEARSPWRNIPEEYTITVEDTSRVVNARPGISKIPPPVMPKPRNVSQV